MMLVFLLNLSLAFVYVLLTGDASFFNSLIGFAIAFIILTMMGWSFGYRSYPQKVFKLVSFVAYFIRILIQANLGVAKEIITPGHQMTPRIIRYDTDGLTPVQTTFLANAITLTPGTLTADISADGRWLYLHAMYAQDRETAIAEIDELRNRIMREVFE